MAVQIKGIVYELVAPAEAYIHELESKVGELTNQILAMVRAAEAKAEAEAKAIVTDVKTDVADVTKDAKAVEGALVHDKSKFVAWLESEVKDAEMEGEKIVKFVENIGKKL